MARGASGAAVIGGGADLPQAAEPPSGLARRSRMDWGIRRAAEMAAVFMIGDGLLGLLQPERHVELWRSDVTAVDLLVRPFGGHPGRRRLYGLAQIAAGLTLASRLRAPDKG